MKRAIFLFTLLAVVLTMSAQQPRKFDPEKFQADLEQFITTHAPLTPQEAQAFFPLYREMQKKQRVCFDEIRRCRKVDMTDNRACLDAIKKQDEMDLEIKQIQQTYHQKFVQVLPASKVLQVLKAEEKFHRQAFKNAAHKREEPNK